MRLVLLLLAAALAAEAQQYRAFWADAFHSGFKNPADIDQMVENLAPAKANAVFVQVRRRGDSYYLRSLEPPAQDSTYAPGFDALEYLVQKARPRGIEVHAWFVVGPLWLASLGSPQDPRHAWHSHGPGASGDEMWMTVDSTGKKISNSLDLGHPDAARYLADVILEPARHYELDGIHLDYIRYPEDADYGWNPKAIERFQRLANRTGNPSPSDPAWAEFRRKQVTDLVRQIYLRAYAIRPSTKVSAALITWGNGPASDSEYLTKDAYRRVFQDWRNWMEEGILDLGIPMNYFREASYSAWLDRWLEYEKDRQFRRAMMPGLGIYLNSITDSISQARRVLAPSAAGNKAIGVNFYSYASTNTLVNNVPARPNQEFYRAAAELFGDSAVPPALSWKANPDRGHIYGWLEVDGGPAWLKDGATVWIESETGGRAVHAITDGTGFFGAVDLPPDRYRVRIERSGKEIHRATAQELQAGAAARFDIRLKAEEFAPVLPLIRGTAQGIAAPGDVVVLSGSALARESAQAPGVPLPQELAGVQVVVNGLAASLYSVSPERIVFQAPYERAESWSITVRHDGLESVPFLLGGVEASPVILAVRRAAGGYLEIYATGLGLTDPPATAGTGGAASEPYNLVVLPVSVRLRAAQGEFTLQPLYAGLAPSLPGCYQVNVRLPEGVAEGEVRFQVGPALSAGFIF